MVEIQQWLSLLLRENLSSDLASVLHDGTVLRRAAETICASIGDKLLASNYNGVWTDAFTQSTSNNGG